nr:DUF6785 family protein [Armatimonas sp.]
MGDDSTAPVRTRVRWGLTFPIALVLILLNAFWVIRAERVGSGPFFSTISLFANGLFLLSIVLLLNWPLRRFAPKLALCQGELLLIYAMVSVGGALAGQDMCSALLPLLAHPYQFGNATNNWLERFGQFLPKAVMVGDTPTEKEALKLFYQGHSTLYTPEHLNAWQTPVLLWTGFVAVLFWTMLCLSVLMRQGWQDRERLPFPVIELPIQLTEQKKDTLWTNKLFWIGFGLVACVEILNGLASLYPQLPTINLQHTDVAGTGIFATSPWNAAGFTCYSFYPFAVGLGYLLPLDLIFSCWFFYLFWKAQLILSRLMAWDVTPDFPFVREQAFGGYIALLVFLLWNGRSYFAQMWKRIWKEASDLDDSQEALSYRQALVGFLIGFLAMVGFFAWMGLSPLVSFAAFFIYIALALAVGRIRAELGPPVHDLHFSGPDHILTRSFGTPAFSGQDLTILTFFYWFNRAYRSHPMPFAIEGLKAAKDVKMSQKVMFWGLVLAGAFGAFAALWAYLHLSYDFGASGKMRGGQGFSAEGYNRLNGWMTQPQAPNGIANGAMVVGFVFCALLMIARIKFPWWPFHPIGYAISGSWSMNLVWMPLLFAWILKGLILRYGGVRMYRQAMPFFLGLILGQCIVGSFWHLIGWALDIQPYSFWGG